MDFGVTAVTPEKPGVAAAAAQPRSGKMLERGLTFQLNLALSSRN
jgi:hypothetical protein